MVKVLECGARGPGFNPHPKEKKNFLFQMDIEEVEVIKDHRPIGHGPFFQHRSMGPLPSSLPLLHLAWSFLHAHLSILIPTVSVGRRPHCLTDGRQERGT